jgi:CheY-like chemotaxis protein
LNLQGGSEADPHDVLLVEDNPADVRLVKEAFLEGPGNERLHVCQDGTAGIEFLRRADADAHRPDLVLLDLNLPGKGGREVLAEIKSDEDLRRIPVVVLTTSRADEDIQQAYHLNANCYVTKPMDLDEFIGAVRAVMDFWLRTAELPAD